MSAAPILDRHSSQISPSPFAAWIMMAVLVATVGLLGGTSRADAVQIAALRPLCALLLIPAFYYISWQQMMRARLPLLLLALMGLWILIQLVPLPPSLWQSLPDRSAIAELDGLVGLDSAWRPISFVPARGANALAAFIVPVIAFTLALAARLKTRDLLLIVAAIGVVDATLGFAQIATGSSSLLYTYRSTNIGSAVGLFANENHSGVFSAVATMASAKIAIEGLQKNASRWLKIFGPAAFVIAMLGVVVNGSRAGFVVGLLALVCSISMAFFSLSAGRANRKKSRGQHLERGQTLQAKLRRGLTLDDPIKAATIVVVAILLIAALFVLNGRVAGLEDVLNSDSFEDLRWYLFPTLETMMATHWMFGTGIGSFEEVYHIYEATDLLLPLYVNHAHNDWAQLIIEGGLPALLLLAALLGWIAYRLKMIAARPNGKSDLIFWAGVFGILVLVSIPDYPLRIPLFQAVAMWLILGLALDDEKRPAEPK